MVDPLPSATLTLLFTDIEGSTQRWEHQRAAMAAALARHDAILRAAIEDHGGTVFKTVGDAFCAVFGSAAAAVAAAVAAQRALAAEDWTRFGADLGALWVRMGLHAGEVEMRDGDYFGPAVNRVARLMACGHGGQILVSGTVAGLVTDGLPPGCGLRDLGERRLKDLRRPEHVFQVLGPDLTSEFPPLASLDVRPHNLPVQVTALVGREREMAELARLLTTAGTRLVTLTGPGGTGKTRLALQVAADLVDAFADGAWLVDLAAITDAELVAPTVAAALAIPEVPGEPILTTLVAGLDKKRLLLVLDNFEQVLAAAPMVTHLLSHSPHITLLVTSRASLNIRGEREYSVEPLSVPSAAAGTSVAALAASAAVELFVQRARDVRQDFRVTPENAATIAAICARLDGLPLALELAATRIRMLPPAVLLERLDHRLALLAGGRRDLPARQQTIRDTIAWSHDLLAPPAQGVFRRLGAFSGGWSLDAAEAVAGPDDGVDVYGALEDLVANHLVRAEELADGDLRFRMLETIREFAIEALEAAGEADPARARHTAWFADLAADFEEDCYWHGGESRWFERLEREHDNCRAALAWSLGDPSRRAGAVRLAAYLARFWQARHPIEGWRHLTAVAVVCAGDESTEAALVRYYRAQSHMWTGDLDTARAELAAAASEFRGLGDSRHLAWALNDRGVVLVWQGDLASAEGLFEESIAVRQHDCAEWEQGMAYLNLGEVHWSREELDRAGGRFAEAIAVLSRVRPVSEMEAEARKDLGHVLRATGDLHGAESTLRQALAIAHDVGSRYHVAKCLAGLASVAAAGGDGLRCAVLAAATEAILADIRTALEPIDRQPLDAAVAAAKAQLASPDWAAAWAQGAALSPDDAVAWANASALDRETPLALAGAPGLHQPVTEEDYHDHA